MSCGIAIEYGCSMPNMTSASATWSGSSVLSCRFSCSRLSRMSSRRRSPDRRSWSPRWSIRESLLGEHPDQRTGHVVRAFELQPVAGTLQDLEPKLTTHVSGGVLSLQTTERQTREWSRSEEHTSELQSLAY